MDVDDASNQKNANKPAKIPPIIITSDVNTLALLNKAQLTGTYSQKIISIGTKIYVHGMDDFNRFLELLVGENIEFY